MPVTRMFELQVGDLFRLNAFDAWKEVRKIENGILYYYRFIRKTDVVYNNPADLQQMPANSMWITEYIPAPAKVQYNWHFRK